MPTFNVRLDVNVPGVGNATSNQTGIVAPTMEEAITKAKTNVVIAPTLVQQTAP